MWAAGKFSSKTKPRTVYRAETPAHAGRRRISAPEDKTRTAARAEALAHVGRWRVWLQENKSPPGFPGRKRRRRISALENKSPARFPGRGLSDSLLIDLRSAREVLQSPAGLLEDDRARFGRTEHDPHATLRRAASKAGLPPVCVPGRDACRVPGPHFETAVNTGVALEVLRQGLG
jgi:hypothetical protein